MTETGWGEFTINIRVQFVAEASEKPLNLAHNLKLHHWGTPIEAPPPVSAVDSPASQPTAPSSGITPAPATAALSTPAAEQKAQTTESTEKPQGDAVEEKQQGQEEGETETEVKTETAASTPAPADSITAIPAGDVGASNESMTTQHINSVAARLPVHAWQYDELVFSDPPSAFLDIMNEHPATPLPAKFRRPKDQREKEEGSRKKLKGRPSASAVVSRAQTQEPGVNGTPAPQPIGIHGEPGSADVPLEFAKEMEVGEANRLVDVKISIIEQMDKLR